ncbi:MAG: Resolvase domain protein [Bryobacterales bacterium]|nr:Resolvase domain protein [Bryobacterales bacterium]
MRNNNQDVTKPTISRLRCAIYTRKSTEEGLDQDFNSLDAQREAAEAFILSQRREGWVALPESYDDGGFTGANMDRPALTKLLRAVEAGELDCVVVYKVDRLSRSLLDFTRMLSVFEKHKVKLRCRHPAVQHQHLAGAADAQHPAFVCAVRARTDQRAYARQNVGGATQGKVGRRIPDAGL